MKIQPIEPIPEEPEPEDTEVTVRMTRSELPVLPDDPEWLDEGDVDVV